MSDNPLIGTIPTEIGDLSRRLTTLRLSRTELGGKLPTELGKLTGLEYLYAQGLLRLCRLPASPAPGEPSQATGHRLGRADCCGCTAACGTSACRTAHPGESGMLRQCVPGLLRLCPSSCDAQRRPTSKEWGAGESRRSCKKRQAEQAAPLPRHQSRRDRALSRSRSHRDHDPIAHDRDRNQITPQFRVRVHLCSCRRELIRTPITSTLPTELYQVTALTSMCAQRPSLPSAPRTCGRLLGLRTGCLVRRDSPCACSLARRSYWGAASWLVQLRGALS
jgi:hypothetical protein